MAGGETLKNNEQMVKNQEALNEQNAVNTITSADKKTIDNAVKTTKIEYPLKAEKNKEAKEASIGMITDYIDTNFDMIASRSDQVYIDLFKNILKKGTSSQSLNNINFILLDLELNNNTKNMILKGIVENIKERTEKDKSRIQEILDKKANPEERAKLADDLLQKSEIDGMTVNNKKMSYIVESDGRIRLGEGWFGPGDPRNGEIGPGQYDPTIFKNERFNQSLKDKAGSNALRERYFLVDEHEEVRTLYNQNKIREIIVADSNNISEDAKITVNINEHLPWGSINMIGGNNVGHDKNGVTDNIKNIISENTENKKPNNVTVNFVGGSQAGRDVRIDVNVPEKKEILGNPENVLLTTTFDKTKSDIDEGGRREQLIQTFGPYLKQDENGKWMLNTDDYRIFKIDSIQGNASSIYDPNVPQEEAKTNNEQYAKDRLNTALAFLNDIGTPPELIHTASQTSQVNYERQDEIDQNIKINWQVQSVVQKAEEARTYTINVEMPTEKLVTWDVIHTRLSTQKQDDKNTFIF